jgi:hypothetical protein
LEIKFELKQFDGKQQYLKFSRNSEIINKNSPNSQELLLSPNRTITILPSNEYYATRARFTPSFWQLLLLFSKFPKASF